MNRRVLIVNSQSIYYNNATGITLRSIFEKIDATKLMEVYWSADNEDHQIQNIALNYPKHSFSGFLMKRRKSKYNTVLKKNGIGNTKSAKKLAVTYLRQYLAVIPDMEALEISDDDISGIEDFHPEVIYTLGGSVNSLRIAYDLSQKYGIPIVVHHMDNWMHSIQWEDNPLLAGYKKQLRELCRKCYTRSTLALTISEEMAKAFTEEFGILHEAIMNSIDVKSFECEETRHSPFRFTYAGGLHLERYQALMDIAECLEEFNAHSSAKAELAIYTGRDNLDLYADCFRDYSCVKLFEAVPHERIKEIYQSSDALVHVESKTLEGSDFFKYSISTKIPEYLSTGKPVLFYGPESIYLYRFLLENDLAFTVCNRDGMRDSIKQIISDKAVSEIKTINAKRYAFDHFDTKIAIKQMEEVLDTVQLP